MTGRRVISSTAAEIQPQSVEWAWQGLVPLGMLSITAGAPGWGKTQLMIGMCAKATRGQLPGALHGSPANVAYISAEDSLEHTLAPRFRAVGADLERVHLFRHVATNGRNGDEETPHIRIPDDVPLVTDWLTELDARILVCDPVVALIPTNLNTHRDQDTRRALAPLMHIAERHSIAVCLVMHLNKTIEADALNRLSGSVGFGGAARSVLLFAPDPDDPEGENGNRRILAHVKCNVGPRQRSLAYTVEPRVIDSATGPIETSVVVRQGYADASANDLTSGPTSASAATARTEAKDFLLAELANGPQPSIDIQKRAEDAGISIATLKRAKSQLGIRAVKVGAAWTWQLAHTKETTPSIAPLDPLESLDPLEGKEIKEIKESTNGALSHFDADTDVLLDAERAETLLARHGDEQG